MAIAVGSVVSPRLRGADLLSGAVSPQPPMFGKVQDLDVAATDVLWYDGKLVLDIDLAALDEISDASPTNLELRGLVVVVTGEANAARMVVNDVYVRAVGDEDFEETFASCKLLNSDGWRDLPISALTAVSGGG